MMQDDETVRVYLHVFTPPGLFVNMQHVCSLWTRWTKLQMWKHLNTFVPLYTAPASKHEDEDGETVQKIGSVGKQDFGFLFDKLSKYRHRLSELKIHRYWKSFHLFNWRTKFLLLLSTFVGDCSESDEANWPSDNQMDIFLKFLQCVHRKLLSRWVRTEKQICPRDKIQNEDFITFQHKDVISHPVWTKQKTTATKNSLCVHTTRLILIYFIV